MTTTHRGDSWPQPSGWRVQCTCGWDARGITRDQVTTLFLEHAEQTHGTITQDNT